MSFLQFIEIRRVLCGYEKGIVNRPIVAIDHINTFFDKNAENIWTYYCCGQTEKVANRFIAMPSYRNRVLGLQLYKYNILGFLQWGFNFWYSWLSRRVINPLLETCADGAFPAGDPFVVYPLDREGRVVCSLRLYVFNEALQDLRALKLLEQIYGREKAVSLLDDIVGMKEYPKNNEYYINLRNEINSLIEKGTVSK